MRFISSRRQNAGLLLLLSVGNRRVVISDNHSARTALPPNGRPWKLFIYTRPTTDVRNRDDSSPWSHVRVCVHRRPVRVKRSRGYFPVWNTIAGEKEHVRRYFRPVFIERTKWPGG